MISRYDAVISHLSSFARRCRARFRMNPHGRRSSATKTLLVAPLFIGDLVIPDSGHNDLVRVPYQMDSSGTEGWAPRSPALRKCCECVTKIKSYALKIEFRIHLIVINALAFIVGG